jgi:hypothetical protein
MTAVRSVGITTDYKSKDQGSVSRHGDYAALWTTDASWGSHIYVAHDQSPYTC